MGVDYRAGRGMRIGEGGGYRGKLTEWEQAGVWESSEWQVLNALNTR